MAFSSGTYSLVAGNPVVTATTISSTTHNNTMTDIATALSTCILKDGTQTTTATIPFASKINIGTGGTLATGDIGYNASYGLSIAGRTGATADFAIWNASAASIVGYNPTGTVNWVFGGTLGVTGNAGIASAAKLYLDGVALTGNTYIQEVNADSIGIYAGGTLAAKFNAGSFVLPATSTPTGTGSGEAGQTAWDTAYFYICTATNDWRRIALVDF